VEAYIEGCLNVMAELGMIERDPPPSASSTSWRTIAKTPGTCKSAIRRRWTGFFRPRSQLARS
jgi:hypothetical protein